ncbi:MAG TPA: Yip1 family protein, partial [Thermoanaerobaculia bacterium]|nr:Yip1 family protein [Thermoanaerobaculia bacterium]
PSFLARVGGVMLSPVETFESIARRPDVLFPLLAIVIISIITGTIVASQVDFEPIARETMEQQSAGRPAPPPEQFDRGVKFMAGFWKALAYASPVFSIVIFGLIAGVLLLAFRLFGGEGNFKQAFSITLYAWIPLLIKGIIATIVLTTRENLTLMDLQNPVRSNLGFLVEGKSQPFAFALLSSVDVLTIWALVLFILGFSAMSRFSRVKSAVVVLSLWAVTLLLKLGGAAMQAARIQS